MKTAAENGRNGEKTRQPEDSNLTGILDMLCGESENGRLKISDILESLNHRGFGPLLLAPALLVVLPTGAIPGVPALCGLFILMVSAQIFTGKKYPWMPRRIKELSFRSARFQSGVRRFRPYAEKIDRYVENRFAVLARNQLSHRLVALTSMVLALVMIFIGFIPFVPALLALPIMFFALGLSVHDGLLLAIGYAALLLAVFIMPLLMV